MAQQVEIYAQPYRKSETAVVDRGQMPITHDSHDFMKKHPVGHDEEPVHLQESDK